MRAREGKKHNGTGGSLEVERLELPAAARDLVDVREADVRQVELFKVRATAPNCDHRFLRQLLAIPVTAK